MIHIKDPLALAMEVLPPNWHFLPKVLEKSIKFYKSILTQEKFAQIEYGVAKPKLNDGPLK